MKSKELQGKKFGECLTIKNLRNGLRGGNMQNQRKWSKAVENLGE